MLIIDYNLKTLAHDEKICSRDSLIEDFCIQIRLSDGIYYRPKKDAPTIRYGSNNKSIEKFYDEKNNADDDNGIITLFPGDQILACSKETYSLPKNIFGLVQTKGTLARMFVQVTCCDGQIEPGFKGKITLEIVNLSPFKIEIPTLSSVAQLYLFNCSMTSTIDYTGKYSGSEKPTLPNFDGF